MPKKVAPSESSISSRFKVKEINGKFYVEEEYYNELAEKLARARDTISYTIDKWFLSIENRMKEQDKRVTTLTKYERAVDKVHDLEKEIRQLNKTIHELKMEIVKSKPHYRQEWAGQQVCCSKEFKEKRRDFIDKLKFGETVPTFEEPVKLSGTFFNSENKE